MAKKGVTTEYYGFDSLKWHFKYFMFLGVTTKRFPKYQQTLYNIYAVFIIFLAQFYQVFYLAFGLFQLNTPRDIIGNVSMAVSQFTSFTKIYILFGTINAFQDIKNICEDFEKEAKKNKEEYAHILEFKSTSKNLMKFYYVSCSVLVVFAALSCLTFDSRRLMFPGYFPYDYTKNRFVYGMTSFYEWLAWSITAFGNVHHDTFPGLLICLLNKYIDILNVKISRIGNNSLSPEENHQLLKAAVEDHRRILRFRTIINDSISKTSLLLYLASSFNMVACVVALAFFADNLYQKIYFTQLTLCFALQTATSCYYGSEFEYTISQLTESLYSCNWIEQSKGFKTTLLIFLECSLRKYTFIAGGIFPINKVAFMKIIKGVFSLYTVLNHIRQKF